VLSLPFRALGIVVGSVFALLRALLFLPARVLGYRPRGGVMGEHPVAAWHRLVRERDATRPAGPAGRRRRVPTRRSCTHAAYAGARWSPATWRAALQLLNQPGFRYVREFLGDNEAMLEFETEIERHQRRRRRHHSLERAGTDRRL
jgi:hypothetical protein